MLQRFIILTCVFLGCVLGADGATAGSAVGNPAVASGRNDLVYLAPATEPYEAMPLGNGRLGAMVRNQGGMTYILTPGSCFASADQNQLLISSGELTLRLPEAWIDGFVEQRLVLHDATVVTRFKTGSDTHTVTSWLAEGLDVLVVEIESTATLPDMIAELWIWPRTDYGKPTGLETKRVAADGAVALSTVGLSKARATALMVEPLEKIKTETELQGDRARLTIPSDGRQSVTILAASPVARGKDLTDDSAIDESRAVLKQARAAGVNSLRKQHEEYWHAFWSKTSVLMHSEDGFADYVENLYNMFLYCMAGCSRGEDAPKFNGGNYILCNDWRSWGGQYWYQNTREMYWSLLAADHPELWSPFIDLYWRHLPAFEKLARDFFGADGACVEETLNGFDGGGDKANNPYTCLYLSTGTEVGHQLYQYYLYTRDERFLKEKAYPFMKQTVTFHLNFLNREEDGRYHVYPTNARETFWWVKDSTSDLTALKTMLPILISVSERLGVDEKERIRWKDVLTNLTPFVTQGEGYAPAKLLNQFPKTRFEKLEVIYTPIKERRTTRAKGNKFNCENVDCEPPYPWGLIGLHSPPEELARMRATYRQRTFNEWNYGNAWDWSAPAAARLGMTDEVVKRLHEYVRNVQMFPNGCAATPAKLPEIWGKQVTDYIAFDSHGVLAATVQEMQLQSYGGRIRVFPAWPKGWQSEFTLAAEGDFLVSSRIRDDGGIPYITILSRKGGPCNVVNPWRGKITIKDGGQSQLLKSNAVLNLTTKPGRTYELRPEKSIADGNYIAMARNMGPKWPFHQGSNDTAEAYLQRTNTHGFIGITSDGQNATRNRVRKATGEDSYPHPPKLLLSADFDRSLDADTADGVVQAQGNGAKRITGGAPTGKPHSEAADIGYSGDSKAQLSYDVKGKLDVKQGTIAFWVKTKWDWDPKIVKNSRNLVSISLPIPGNQITVYAYMQANRSLVGFYMTEDGKQHSCYFPVTWKKDEWHHIAATWNGWRTQLFVDGQRVNREFYGDSPFKLGQRPTTVFVGGGPTSPASGILIDELQIWNQPLKEVVLPVRKQLSLNHLDRPANYPPQLTCFHETKHHLPFSI